MWMTFISIYAVIEALWKQCQLRDISYSHPDEQSRIHKILM